MQAFGLLRKGRTNRKPLFDFYKIFRNLKSENALSRHPHCNRSEMATLLADSYVCNRSQAPHMCAISPVHIGLL